MSTKEELLKKLTEEQRETISLAESVLGLVGKISGDFESGWDIFMGKANEDGTTEAVWVSVETIVELVKLAQEKTFELTRR